MAFSYTMSDRAKIIIIAGIIEEKQQINAIGIEVCYFPTAGTVHPQVF